MTDLSRLSNAQSILLAVQLCLNGDISAFPYLRSLRPDVLQPRLLLRIILTFLPESIEPARYVSYLEPLVDNSGSTDTSLDIDISSVQGLSDADAHRQVRSLRLLPLAYSESLTNDSTSLLVQFLIHRAHRIDSEIGVQPFILDLVGPFIHSSDILRDWAISTVLPSLRFNYEYHPDKEGSLSLELIESLDARSAVNILLSATEKQNKGGNVGRDLRGLIGPWIYGHACTKRRKLNQSKGEAAASNGDRRSSLENNDDWKDVNEWVLSTSIRDFALAVEAIEQWSGPQDVDLGGYGDSHEPSSAQDAASGSSNYTQAGLASIYALSDVNRHLLDGACRIVSRVTSILNLDFNSTLRKHDASLQPLNIDTSFEAISAQWLLHNTLLEHSNPLTSPNLQSVAFIDALLGSIRILNDWGYSMTPSVAAEIIFFGNEEAQLFKLREVIETLSQRASLKYDWRRVRERLLWLRNWGANPDLTADSKHSPSRGIFGQIPLHQFEREILIAILTVKQYDLAVDLYTRSPDSSPLPQDEVESTVVETIFIAYDNATNGNKTRGGIKKAADMLDSFSPSFPASTSFKQIRALISATHALSFYSLTLQHGVPFQPVSIRVHQDPLSLIEKVLEQNPKAYTQLDDLLAIGRNLVTAGLDSQTAESDLAFFEKRDVSPEQALLAANHRILSLAISSAVKADDFDTAYSYIVTRLTPSTLAPAEDNVSWRAAYNTGRHRSAAAESTDTTLESRISRLSQQMELLSLALVLAPSAESLPEILAVWRRCDEEMASLQAQELEEAESWDTRGDITSMSGLPGGFGPSVSELDAMDTERERERRLRATRVPRGSRLRGYDEAPMGLFEVARGAAQAISKNTFPLSASASSTGPNITADHGHGYDHDHEASRTRKRDVVSNMVTGGLVSGIGWVLGAQPTNTDTSKEGS